MRCRSRGAANWLHHSRQAGRRLQIYDCIAGPGTIHYASNAGTRTKSGAGPAGARGQHSSLVISLYFYQMLSAAQGSPAGEPSRKGSKTESSSRLQRGGAEFSVVLNVLIFDFEVLLPVTCPANGRHRHETEYLQFGLEFMALSHWILV